MKTKKPKTEQLEKWHDEDEHKMIINAIEAVPENERDFELIKILARAYANCYRYDKGYELLSHYEKEGKNDALWHWRMGLCLYETGKRTESVHFLSRAIALGDDHPETARYLKMAQKTAVSKTEAEACRRLAFVPRDPRREPFEGFDLSGFWDDEKYAVDEYAGADATEKMFSEAEKTLGYKLPESYRRLMRGHNGGMPKKGLFVLPGAGFDEPDEVNITGIMGVDPNKTNSLCGSFGSRFMIDEWGYPDIGIAICDCPSTGHKMVFLDYRDCGRDGEPAVVHINQKKDYEITYLAGDLEGFIRGLSRKEDRAGGGTPELYTEQELDAVEDHITAHFGIYRNVIREHISPDIRVNIYVVEPTPERNHYTLVTVGMGAHRMNVPEEVVSMKLDRAELLVTLPPDWKVYDDDERWHWPLRWLKNAARLPSDQDTWLFYWYTVTNYMPYAENTKFCSVMLTPPYFFGAEAEVCKLPDGDDVNFYQMLPLYESEMNFKRENNAEALENLFPSDFNMVVNINRKNVVSQSSAGNKAARVQRGGNKDQMK